MRCKTKCNEDVLDSYNKIDESWEKLGDVEEGRSGRTTRWVSGSEAIICSCRMISLGDGLPMCGVGVQTLTQTTQIFSNDLSVSTRNAHYSTHLCIPHGEDVMGKFYVPVQMSGDHACTQQLDTHPMKLTMGQSNSPRQWDNEKQSKKFRLFTYPFIRSLISLPN